MKREHLDFLKEYGEEMKKIPLPSEIRENYEILECLKDGEESGTFLAQERHSGAFCVIKCARGKFRKFLKQEYILLRELTEKKFTGIPRPYAIVEAEEEVFFLREYIEGGSLCEYVCENGTLSWRRIAEIGGEICKIVEQFQNLDNPLIHRDIKPENLILTDGGNLMLVDFGTMRSYRAEGPRDTFLIGSDGTAAPEQYGFCQTDRRTDVYAIGRTLWFLAAGCYQEDALKEADISRRMRRIIYKAAAFDPGKRYPSAAELRKALEGCRRADSYWFAAAAAGAVCVLAVGTGYYLHTGMYGSGKENTTITAREDSHTKGGNMQEDSEEKDTSEEYIFIEPMIEKAVRLQLGIGEDEPVTEAMLGEIRKLKIVGKEIYEPDAEVSCQNLHFSVDGIDIKSVEEGEISDLSDLSHMRYLFQVILGRQKIKDLSPLEGMAISELNVAENQIEDFSVLGTMPYLKRLNIGSNPGEELQSLAECASLEELKLDGMNIKNVDFVENLPVTVMTMWVTSVKSGSLEPLTKMKKLSSLEIWLSEGELQPEIFSRMENLTLLSLGAFPFKDLTDFEECPQMKTLDIIDGLESAAGLDRFPNLTFLNLRSEKLSDLSPILQAEKLEEICINMQIILDYTPLLQHPNLKKVYCTEHQKEAILSADPEPKFEICVV